MNTNEFFPSIYDPRNASGDIWASLSWSRKKGDGTFAPQPWPLTTTLVMAEYLPLDFFSPRVEGPLLPWTEDDDICELSVRLKEIELLYQLGEEFDDRRHYFLSTVQYEKEIQMRSKKDLSLRKRKSLDDKSE